MTTPDPPDADAVHLRRAVLLSRACEPVPDAFSVGAIIVDAGGREIACGRSRETGPRLHAEEVALARAAASAAGLRGATLYSSLEPCGVRRSGATCCAARIRAAGIARVVFALEEPPVLAPGGGAAALRRAGLVVVRLGDFASEVSAINAHVLRGDQRRDDSSRSQT